MRSSPISLLLGLSVALLTGCTSGDDDDINTVFELKNTKDGVPGTTPLLADGNLLAYLASEASTGKGGTDLNGDGDTIDAVAVRVNTLSNNRHNLGVATQSMAFLNRTLFLVVSEDATVGDNKDWNGDADKDDTVLLYVESSATTPTFLAELDGAAATPMAVVAGRLLFAGATAPASEFRTNLWSTTVASLGAAPEAPVAVTSTIDDPNDDGVSLSIWAVEDGMAFLTMDETVDGDLNGDADALDTAVLALIDAGDAAAQVTSVGIAVDPAGSVSALQDGGDWTVAFLADEAGEGVNLNDPALFDPSWQPANCSGLGDTDTTDHVLHWLLYSDFVATGSVVNTGLVGSVAATEFVYALKSGGGSNFVGVVSLESDEGSGSGCDLNGDGDFVDRIFRWVDATDPDAAPLPVTDEDKLLAIADGVPGDGGDSTGGVIAMDRVWVILVDEAADGRDHDGNAGQDNLLIAVHAPSNVAQLWNFDHGTESPGPVSVSWMARNPRDPNAFVAALTEDVLGFDLNDDGDLADSVPTFPERESGVVLKFPGFGIAVDADDAGIASANGVGFYRVSEAAEDSSDLNGDGDTNDFLLQRIGLTTNDLPTFMGSLNGLSRPAVSVAPSGPVLFGALLFQENQVGGTGQDLNGDGDAKDFVVRYFRFP